MDLQFCSCHFTYSLPDHCHPTASLFYLYSVSSFISMSMLVDMPPCFWCSSSCFHFALCLKVWMSLHIVCGCMIEEHIWYQWERSKFVYHIIDWWQTSTLIYWQLLKQWNSIHCRQFWEAIFCWCWGRSNKWPWQLCSAHEVIYSVSVRDMLLEQLKGCD